MGFILTGSSKITCPHGGILKHNSSNIDVPYIHGSPICVMNDGYDILTCPLHGSLRCNKVEWKTGSVLTIKGSPVLTHLSVGLCYSNSLLLTGVPIIIDHQREYMADDVS